MVLQMNWIKLNKSYSIPTNNLRSFSFDYISNLDYKKGKCPDDFANPVALNLVRIFTNGNFKAEESVSMNQ